MSSARLDRGNATFLLIEDLVKNAIKRNIELDTEWAVSKVPFENRWEAQALHKEVEKAYGFQVAGAEVEVDFANDNDLESLTNCYVSFDVRGALGDLFVKHGLLSKIEIDVFNEVVGSSVVLLSAEDVDNNLQLLNLWIEIPGRLEGLIDQLKNVTTHHSLPHPI